MKNYGADQIAGCALREMKRKKVKASVDRYPLLCFRYWESIPAS